jgi:hypothetical protein
MDCTTLQAIFSGDHADDLDPAAGDAFEQHLRACDRCRDALARAEGDLEPVVQLLEPPALPPEAWGRVTQKVKAEAARPVLKVHAGGGLPRGLAIAAAVLLAVGVGLFLPLDLFRQGGPASPNGGVSDISHAVPPTPVAPSTDRTPTSPAAPSTPSQPASPAVATRAKVTKLECDSTRFAADFTWFDAGGEQVLYVRVHDL